MAPKRPRDEEGEARKSSKKQKKGFQVGPANLPDGTYKRKVQKIKKDLIHKAKLKQSYAKVKAREQPTTTQPSIYSREASPTSAPASPAPEPTLEPHPDRQRLLDEPSPPPQPPSSTYAQRRDRKKRPKPQPFKSETSLAQKRKEEAEARRREREEAEKERQKRLAERERFRKQMAKARGRPGEQRKLGRESGVLLEKVRRMVGQA